MGGSSSLGVFSLAGDPLPSVERTVCGKGLGEPLFALPCRSPGWLGHTLALPVSLWGCQTLASQRPNALQTEELEGTGPPFR